MAKSNDNGKTSGRGGLIPGNGYRSDTSTPARSAIPNLRGEVSPSRAQAAGANKKLDPMQSTPPIC